MCLHQVYANYHLLHQFWAYVGWRSRSAALYLSVEVEYTSNLQFLTLSRRLNWPLETSNTYLGSRLLVYEGLLAPVSNKALTSADPLIPTILRAPVNPAHVNTFTVGRKCRLKTLLH